MEMAGLARCMLCFSLVGIAACENRSTITVGVTQLSPAAAEIDSGFTYISSVRELADGRVLISDPREERLVVADFQTARLSDIGRKGHGPNEWSHAVALHPLAGDSSLQMDFVARRWLTFHRDRIVGSRPSDDALVVNTIGRARATDTLGHVLAIQRPLTQQAGVSHIGERDSVAVVLYSRQEWRADTVGKLRDAPATIHSVRSEDGRIQDVFASRPALAVAEDAALFLDGWIAFARLDPYRVDWRSPDGKFSLGSALPVAVVVMDERERAGYLERAEKQFADPEGHMPPKMREAIQRRFTDLPPTVPPFGPFSLLAGADGNLYIRRTPTADSPEPRYDVIDRTGNLVQRLQLAIGERIAAIGASHLYVVWKDENEVERLRKHVIPAGQQAVPRNP